MIPEGFLRQFHGRGADVPAMELYRYASILRSLTGGRGLLGQ